MAKQPEAASRTTRPTLPGAEVFAQHLLRDDEDSDKNGTQEYHAPRSPRSSPNNISSSRLHHSFPCLDSSPRYHVKDNLELSVESFGEKFGAGVFADHLLHDKEYPEKELEPDPDHRYHLKDQYVPKEIPTTPKTKLPRRRQPRRHSEPVPKKAAAAVVKPKKRMEPAKADSNRHLKDAFVPENPPECQNNNESVPLESELEFVSLDLPKEEGASAENFAVHLLHDDQYPPEPDNGRPSGSSSDLQEGTPKMNPSPNVLEADAVAKHLLHDNEYPPQESPHENRHNNLKDDFDPITMRGGDSRQHFSHHTEQTPPSKSVAVVAPLPFLSQDRQDDGSVRSVANSQDCASLGSLSYAGHLQKPPLLEEQKGKLHFGQPQLKGRRHFRRHSEPIFVEPLPELSQGRLEDDSSTRSVADSNDCASLGSLLSPLFKEQDEKHCHKEGGKAKRHSRRHSEPIHSPSIMLVGPLPNVSQDRQELLVDDSSTRAVADSEEWASLGSLSYAGHLRKPQLLEEQKEKQHHHHHKHHQNDSKEKAEHQSHRHRDTNNMVLVEPLPRLPDEVKDDTSTRSVADSQDCASLGSLSYVRKVQALPSETPVKGKQRGRPLKARHSPLPFSREGPESPLLSKIDHTPNLPNP